MKQYRTLIIACVLMVMSTVFVVACYGKTSAASGLNGDKKGATDITAEKNQEVYSQLNFTDTQEQEFAERGLITAPDSLVIQDEDGNVKWSQDSYNFVRGTDAPDSANPSLWRNTQLNAN